MSQSGPGMKFIALLILGMISARETYGETAATVSLGKTVTISASADGDVPMWYTWFKDGKPIATDGTANLVLSSVKAEDAGVYAVAVSNAAGSTKSDNAAITVSNMVTLKITTVSTNYPDPAIVSWQRNGSTIPGANDWTYSFDPVAQPGNISARITWPNVPAAATTPAPTATAGK